VVGVFVPDPWGKGGVACLRTKTTGKRKGYSPTGPSAGLFLEKQISGAKYADALLRRIGMRIMSSHLVSAKRLIFWKCRRFVANAI
jgi:hypothetical protein